MLLLAVHAPLLLNNGLVMDDWLVLKPRPDYAVDIEFLLHGAGHPIFFSYFSLANMTTAPILVMKIAALASIICGGVCLFWAATRTNLLTDLEAVGFALIVWTYPGYQLWAGKANAVYIASFGLFFLGLWLLTLTWGARGAVHYLLRILTLLVFFLSFGLNSIMVLYAFAMLGLLVAVWRGGDLTESPIRRAWFSAWRCATRYPDLLVLPLIYWAVLNIWFKRVGVYVGHYNAHVPSLAELADGWRVFFSWAYAEVLKNAVRSARDNRIPLALATLLVLAILLLLRAKSKDAPISARSISLPLLLCPIVFLALALPYLIAGLRPSANFYETRHLLLFGVPAALGLLAIKRAAETRMKAGSAFAAVFGAALIVSITMLWDGYIFLQARTLKQEALSSHLANMPKPDALVFNINDGFLDYPPFGLPEAIGMLKLAWGNEPFVGFTLRAERPTILNEVDSARTAEGSAYTFVDPSGPQATISFLPGPAAAPNGVLVRHYYACKLLAQCDMSNFLTQLAVVRVDIGPIAGVAPLKHPN